MYISGDVAIWQCHDLQLGFCATGSMHRPCPARIVMGERIYRVEEVEAPAHRSNHRGMARRHAMDDRPQEQRHGVGAISWVDGLVGPQPNTITILSADRLVALCRIGGDSLIEIGRVYFRARQSS